MAVVSAEKISKKVGVEMRLLKNQVSDKHLLHISRLIPDWYGFSHYIGLTDQNRNAIQTDPNLNYAMKTLACLKTWKSKNAFTENDTYLFLIQAALDQENTQLAGEICLVLASKPADFPSYLRSLYKSQSFTTDWWPPADIRKYYDLRIIQKNRISRCSINDHYNKESQEADDHQDDIDMDNILDLCDESSRKILLVEGAPGSGKSMLAIRICKKWGRGELFTRFKAVILVRLRDPQVQKAKTIADLLPCADRDMADHAEKIMLSSYCKGILWVLDGWDELPSDLPRDSIIHKLIQTGMFQEIPVHESSVIITSRPVASIKLHSLVSARVEVLGFTPVDLEKYLTECLNEDSKPVLQRIQENPSVESISCLPLIATIIAHLVRTGEDKLISSPNEIFTSLILKFMYSYTLKQGTVDVKQLDSIKSLHDLPEQVKGPFQSLCKLAYDGVKKNKVTFTSDEAPNECIPLGLLQGMGSLIATGSSITFQFLHLSIQDLLAAFYIATNVKSSEQVSSFRELFNQPRFITVFQFYSALTKLHTPGSESTIMTMIPTNTCWSACVHDDCKRGKKELLSLLHCLYESENVILCLRVAERLERSLNLWGVMLRPLDCLAIGYFVSAVSSSTCTSGPFKLLLTGCFINDQGCKYLYKGLSKCIDFNKEVSLETDLHIEIGGNNIRHIGAQHIAELL